VLSDTEATELDRPVNRRSVTRLIFAILIIDGIIGSLVYPVLPDFVRATSRPELYFGLATVVFTTMQMLFAPILGRLSDIYGRSPIFRLAAIGTAVSMLLLLPVRFPLLLLNRFSDGATNGLYAVVKSAIVDVSPPEDVQRNVGLSVSLSYVGFILGPGLAAGVLLIAESSNWNPTRSLVVAGIGFALVNVAMSFRLPETRRLAQDDQTEGTARAPFRIGTVLSEASPLKIARQVAALRRTQPQLSVLLAVNALVTFSIGYYTYFVIFVAESPIRVDGQGIAVMFLYFAVLGLVSNTLFFSRVLGRISPLPTMRILLGLGALCVLGYGLFSGTSIVALYVLLTVDMLTLSLVPALIEGFIGKTAGDTQRGEIFGLSQGVASLMGVLAAVLATVLSSIDLRFPFVAFAFAAGAALVLSFRVERPQEATTLR
jgi:MFS transporter, DHA1 family, tetracycline resistance protein